ncbi:hect e3 ubiquitin [Stylonychia lemnae]|uniref:HECT-type E3 ubiquitin transferase n=1 Tax=Stylonychia lemnae TaxID=5949 RepID=A0A078A1Y1_STYLE|nr:hect e3 ubiquitin [Stylonychia lemnae]|eukprot:CDW75488.1 hect e3 ubiquitin [Stylonychia lemnae]
MRSHTSPSIVQKRNFYGGEFNNELPVILEVNESNIASTVYNRKVSNNQNDALQGTNLRSQVFQSLIISRISDSDEDVDISSESEFSEDIVDPAEVGLEIPDESENFITFFLDQEMTWQKNILQNGKVNWVKKKRSQKLQLNPNLKKLSCAKVRNMQLEEKKFWFEYQCEQRRISFIQDSITLVIQRDNVLRDSFEQFRTTDDFDLHKEIKIHYIDEVAQDAGGITREWVTQLTQQLFSDDQQLFKQMKSDHSLNYFPNQNAKFLYENGYKDYFRFAGQVLAKALFDKIPVNVSLNSAILKKLVAISPKEQKITLEDLRDYDQQIYNSIKFISDDPSINFDEEEFYFTIIQDDGSEIELIKKGKETRVTAQNRTQYAKKVAKYYLYKQVKTEIDEFVKGFLQVIPNSIISVFDKDELEFIMNGSPTIDIDDWIQNSTYRGAFENEGKNHQVISWFWDILRDLNQEKRRKFLLFCTGNPRLPIEGFKIDLPLFNRKEDIENNINGILEQDHYYFDFE